MRNRGSRNSLNGEGHAVSRPPAVVGANASVPRPRAVVRTNHNGQRHSGTAVAGLPEFPVSETAARAKRGSEAPNPGSTATRPQDDPRLEALRLIAWRMKKLSWTPALFALLLDELYVDDLFTTVVGNPDAIPPRGYAHAVAVAIVLRHSWRPDDLEAVVDRLGAIGARRTRSPGMRA